LINLEDYFSLRKRGFVDRPIVRGTGAERAVSIVTSRGCPFRCVFCSIHLHMGRKWRAHSVEYVLHHVDFLVDKYGVRHIHFEDDNISSNVHRFRGILDGLIKRGTRVTWDTPNGIRVDTLTRDVLAGCKASGCVYLVFGVESGNQRVLDEIVEKRLDLQAVERVAKWCKEFSLDTGSFFVIGFPGETRQDMKDTVGYALRLQRRYDVNPALFVAIPYPGTVLERIFSERNLLRKELSAEEMLGIARGSMVIDGDTFLGRDIVSMRKRLFRWYRFNIVLNFLSFLVRRPSIAAMTAKFLLKHARIGEMGEVLLEILLYKNYILGASGAGKRLRKDGKKESSR
jgi:radical SAM superfamily enzyme YgiQ (UPF0313 family)